MAAGVAQDGDQEIRGAVDDLGLVGEIGGGVHEAHQLHRPVQPVPVATDGLLQLGQQRDRAAFRGLGALFEGQVLAQAALDEAGLILADLAGDVDQVAHLDEGDVVRRRGGRIGQGDAEVGEALLDRVHGGLRSGSRGG